MFKQNRCDWKSNRLHFKGKTEVKEVAHSESSYSLQGLQHDDAVSPDHLKNNPKQYGITLSKAKTANYLGDTGTDHHADAVLLSSRTHFQSLVHHQIHEGIKSTQDSLNVSASIQLHCSEATPWILSVWFNVCILHRPMYVIARLSRLFSMPDNITNLNNTRTVLNATAGTKLNSTHMKASCP